MCSISWPREQLYARINQRVDEMILNGLESEAKSVQKFRDRNALRTVGYKEMFDYLDGKQDLESTIELIKKNSRNYAKRQVTWFKKYSEMIYLLPENFTPIFEKTDSALNEV